MSDAKSTVERFWSHVKKTDECWLWTASKRSKGYGAFTWKNDGVLVQDRAHRYSFVLANGPIPKGLCVLHRCDVPACVNPAHLFLGTKEENNKDMCEKGRHVSGGTYCGDSFNGVGKYEFGEAHHNSKLNSENVLALRKDRLSGMSFSQLAKKYAIGLTTAFKVSKGITWKHV